MHHHRCATCGPGMVEEGDVRWHRMRLGSNLKNPSTTQDAQSRALHGTMGRYTQLASARTASGPQKSGSDVPAPPFKVKTIRSPRCNKRSVRHTLTQRASYTRLPCHSLQSCRDYCRRLRLFSRPPLCRLFSRHTPAFACPRLLSDITTTRLPLVVAQRNDDG